jgi:hypothetical protein
MPLRVGLFGGSSSVHYAHSMRMASEQHSVMVINDALQDAQ